MDKNEFDPAKVEAFADQMINILNSGAISLMISIGHRTGLFDTMGEIAEATSDQIAESSGLNERYVREWLGAMVTGGIVKYNPNNQKYSLPPEHAALLTRKATPNNIAVFAQYISILGSVENKIIECFKKGGGVPYSEYTNFQQVMAEDSGQTIVSSLIDSILPLVPGMLELLQTGINVLDVGCGSGRALNLMAKNFPNSKFIGYDLSEEAISSGKKESEKLGLKNTRFEQKDMMTFEAQDQFDLITAFDAIHDQVYPKKILEKIAQALRPEGTFLMQDIAASSNVDKNIDHPVGPFLYTISCMHCMSVSLAQNGAGLGAMWGKERALEMFREVGFKNIEVKKLPHDFQNYFYIITK